MTIEQTLLQEIDESKRALDGPIDDTIYRREHSKRIELINWVLENMKKPDIQICDLIESKMNEIILKINQTHDIFEAECGHTKNSHVFVEEQHVLKDGEKSNNYCKVKPCDCKQFRI